MHIKNINIQNFKSIKNLKFDAKRINVFIGKPNTGKSNILEAIGLFSESHANNISHFVRMKNFVDIIFNKDNEKNISIKIDDMEFYYVPRDEKSAFRRKQRELTLIRYYKFKLHNNYPESKNSKYLLPPYGENLPLILRYFPRIRRIISSIFKPYGIEIVLKQGSEELTFQKRISQEDDDFGFVVDFDYSLLSDTLLRMMFYYCAVLSNNDSVIVFEEPATKSFPLYVKLLAENIALDERNNQFFIATHNPYMLLSLIEKTPASELNVIITDMNKSGETIIHSMTNDEISEILADPCDVFFNLEKYLETED